MQNDYPYLNVEFTIRDYQEIRQAYIDTGFDGYLVIPRNLMDSIGEEDFMSPWELADGSVIWVPEYLGQIRVIDVGKSFPALMSCVGNEFLIGRGVIDGFRVVFDHGKRIIVEP